MANSYKVCWWYPARVDIKYYGKPRKPTCRVLSAAQHRSAREAAETVLMQNAGAYVRVVSPRGGGRGTVYKTRGGRYTGIASVVKAGKR